MRSGESFAEAISNFGVYSTPLFWGIGLFFHWFGVFGTKFLGFGKDWEERKIKELMEKEKNKDTRIQSYKNTIGGGADILLSDRALEAYEAIQGLMPAKSSKSKFIK